MNGLPLSPLPTQTGTEDITNIIKTDPLEILQQQFNQVTKQIEFDIEQRRQNISRDTDNRLRILDRIYRIDIQALKKKYDKLPKDNEHAQKEWQEFNRLQTEYLKTMERTKGEIDPDLQDLEASKQKQMQELQWDLQARKIRMDQVKAMQAKGIIPEEYARQELYQLAGHSIPVTAFKRPDPIEQLTELNMARINAQEYGNEESVKALDAQINQLTSQIAGIDPNAAKAADKATAFQRAGSKFVKPTKRGPEEPGTLAQGIREIKNKQQPTAKPKYRRNKQTGEVQVSYNGGQTWQMIGK